PRWASCSGLKRNCSSVLWCSLEIRTTSPPRPPSPPLGPPRGTNFSRRKAMQPLPPSPAFTRIRTSSMNNWKGLLRDQAVGLDANKLAHPAAIAELHDAGDLGEQG